MCLYYNQLTDLSPGPFPSLPPSLPLFPFQLDFPNSPNVGWIESTYVDDKIRIGRSPGGLGGKGSVFVFVREGGAGRWAEGRTAR